MHLPNSTGKAFFSPRYIKFQENLFVRLVRSNIIKVRQRFMNFNQAVILGSEQMIRVTR